MALPAAKQSAAEAENLFALIGEGFSPSRSSQGCLDFEKESVRRWERAQLVSLRERIPSCPIMKEYPSRVQSSFAERSRLPSLDPQSQINDKIQDGSGEVGVLSLWEGGLYSRSCSTCDLPIRRCLGSVEW